MGKHHNVTKPKHKRRHFPLRDHSAKSPFHFAINNDDARLLYEPGTPTGDVIREALRLAQQYHTPVSFIERDGLWVKVDEHDEYMGVRAQIRYAVLCNNSPDVADHIRAIGPGLHELTMVEEANAARIHAAITEHIKAEKKALKKAPKTNFAEKAPRKKRSRHSGRKNVHQAVRRH